MYLKRKEKQRPYGRGFRKRCLQLRRPSMTKKNQWRNLGNRAQMTHRHLVRWTRKLGTAQFRDKVARHTAFLHIPNMLFRAKWLWMTSPAYNQQLLLAVISERRRPCMTTITITTTTTIDRRFPTDRQTRCLRHTVLRTSCQWRTVCMQGASKAHPSPQVPQGSTRFNLMRHLGGDRSSPALHCPSQGANRRAIWMSNPSSPSMGVSTSRKAACTCVRGPHADSTLHKSCWTRAQDQKGLTERMRVFQTSPLGRV